MTDNHHKFLFVQIPADVLYDKDMPPINCKIYGVILNWARNDRRYCWASNQFIADEVFVSSSTVKRALSQMKKKGYIKVIKKVLPDGSEERRIYPVISINTGNVGSEITPPPRSDIDFGVPKNDPHNNIIPNNIYISPASAEEVSKPVKKTTSYKPKYNKSDIQTLVSRYYKIRDITNEVLQKQQYTRNAKAGKMILDLSDGDFKRALMVLSQAKGYFEDKNLTWTLETVVKWFEAIEKSGVKEIRRKML